MLLIIVYIVSLLITSAGAIYLLRSELAIDRRRIEQGYSPEVTWLNVILGSIGVLIPIANTIIAIAIIAALLDRPVLVVKSGSHE